MSKYKYQILTYLYDHKDDYVSGQRIAEQLTISRTAVWKAIESLKEEGFIFDSVQNKGYRLKKFPDVWENDLMQLMIRDSHYFQSIHVYNQLESTQQTAHELMLQTKQPFIVISEEQLNGRGRFNRAWDSQGEKGLWMSLVFYPDIPFNKMTVFNLFISLAIADTIGEESQVKWPNDIYIGEHKVCGFLTEITGDADGIKQIICGIGINLNHQPADFPPSIQERATSVAIAKGQSINRYEFFKSLLSHIEKYYQLFLHHDFTVIKTQYKQRSNIWGRTMRYTEGKRQVYGQAVEILDDGRVIVEDNSGERHQFISADIEMQV